MCLNSGDHDFFENTGDRTSKVNGSIVVWKSVLMFGLENIRAWACFHALETYQSCTLEVNNMLRISISICGDCRSTLFDTPSGPGAVFLQFLSLQLTSSRVTGALKDERGRR